MIRNRDNGDWFKHYHKRNTLRDETKCWTDKQNKGAVWTSRLPAIETINANKLKGKVDIVEFELTEIVSDPR
jgi:hypothetical protein